MMLWPIEFHSSGNPGPEQANQCRLDYILPIEKVISIRLVLADMNSAADLGQNHQADEFVFEKDSVVRAVRFFVADAIGERVRVHLSAAALVHAPFEEHRISFRRGGGVGEDFDVLFPGPHGTGRL